MITLTYSDGGLSINLQQAPQVLGVQLQKWMTEVCLHLTSAVQKNIGSAGLIGRRTGNLARAIRFEVIPSEAGIEGKVWPDPDKVPYGAIQEFGGTIVPKRAQHLTIPLDAMLTANLVARGTARQVMDNPAAFGYKTAFVNPRGTVILGQVGSGRDATLVPLFALKTSVVIPARHYLSGTLEQEMPWITSRLEAIAQDTVTAVFEGTRAA